MNAEQRQKMIEFLVRQGYDRAHIAAKDDRGLKTLYELYHPPLPSFTKTEWRMWRGTNRPHTSG